MFTQHYRLNLAEENDRAIAHDLRVRASIVPGDNWWNEKIDGVPFRLADKFGKIGGDSLPRRGVLELDYVVTRPQETAKRMVKDHFELDLAVRQVSVVSLSCTRPVDARGVFTATTRTGTLLSDCASALVGPWRTPFVKPSNSTLMLSERLTARWTTCTYELVAVAALR